MTWKVPEWPGLPLQAHQILGRLHEGPLTPARRQRGVVAGGDGVVDHNVDPAQLGDRQSHGGVDLRSFPHVTGDRARRDPPGAHLFGGPLRPFGFQLGDRNARPFGRQRERNAQSDALPRAGDDRHLPVESSHAIPL